MLLINRSVFTVHANFAYMFGYRCVFVCVLASVLKSVFIWLICITT